MSEYLTTSEVAELLRIKKRKVYDLASSGKLPCTRAIGKLLFPRAEIEDWLNANASGAIPAAAQTVAGVNTKPERKLPAVIAGSHDPLLDWAIRQSDASIATIFESSRDGIRRFMAGEALAAGVHLPNSNDTGWNTTEMQDSLHGQDAVLIEFAKRTRGLATDQSQSDRIRGLGDLSGKRFQPRQANAGSQVFFEKLAYSHGLSLDTVDMLPPVLGERDVVQAVVSGKAQAGFALQAIAAEYDLHFIPLATERFDLIVDRHSYFEPSFQALLKFCSGEDFAKKALELTGYDLSEFGTVHFNVE